VPWFANYETLIRGLLSGVCRMYPLRELSTSKEIASQSGEP
jgi:hypothetical protein